MISKFLGVSIYNPRTHKLLLFSLKASLRAYQFEPFVYQNENAYQYPKLRYLIQQYRDQAILIYRCFQQPGYLKNSVK